MSQSTLTQAVEPPESLTPLARPAPAAPRTEEFDYRPVPPLATAAVIGGGLSFAGLFGLYGLGVCVLAAMLGLAAYVQIRRAQGELGGQGLALTGLCLSCGFFGLGSLFLYSDYVAELPDGYLRVNFPRGIAEKGFIVEDGRLRLHPDVAPLDGQRIFVKGYMWETRQPFGLTSFVLLKDNGECCFGGSPQPHDMMEVRMQNGMTVDSLQGLVAVGGVLRSHLNAGPGEAVYVLEADHFSRARTTF